MPPTKPEPAPGTTAAIADHVNVHVDSARRFHGGYLSLESARSVEAFSIRVLMLLLLIVLLILVCAGVHRRAGS
jgi:hypothetical protein